MDTPNLLVVASTLAVLVFMPRLILQSVGRASDGIAQLFVPPDRALGWPRGVQESDEPWAWRQPLAAADLMGTENVVDLPNDIVELESAEGDGLVVHVHTVHR